MAHYRPKNAARKCLCLANHCGVEPVGPELHSSKAKRNHFSYLAVKSYTSQKGLGGLSAYCKVTDGFARIADVIGGDVDSPNEGHVGQDSAMTNNMRNKLLASCIKC